VTRLPILPLALALAACSGATGPEASPAGPPAESTGGDQASAPAEEPEGPAADDPTADEHMRHHFGLVAQARDAVIRGDVAGVTGPMAKLHEGDYGIEIPQDWMSSLSDMQLEARRGARATTLQEAARAVGMVSRHCGECHSTFGRPEDLAQDAPHPDDRGVRGAMALHDYAAEQMWLGLTVPSHEAWIRGADAISAHWDPLGGAPGEGGAAAEAGPETDESVVRLIEAIRDMGPELREAQTSLARARAYGQLLADCGGCHVAMGVTP
jgi:hypothetical protein